MTGCGYELRWDPSPAYLPIRPNPPMAARWAEHLGRRGRPVLPRGVVPESLTGSTDLGNVSQLVPAIHPMLAVAEPGTSLHTVEFAAAAGSTSGDRGVVDGAAGLALVAADLLCDGDLLAAARAAFEEAR